MPQNFDEILAIEQREVRAMLAGDISELEALWSDKLIVNSTANLISGKEVLLELIRTGRLKFDHYERRTVKVVELDGTIVTTGNETSQLAMQSTKELFICSYMNIWAKESGRLKLAARHVGLIDRVKRT